MGVLEHIVGDGSARRMAVRQLIIREKHQQERALARLQRDVSQGGLPSAKSGLDPALAFQLEHAKVQVRRHVRVGKTNKAMQNDFYQQNQVCKLARLVLV